MKKIITIVTSVVLIFAFTQMTMADTKTIVSDTNVQVYGPLYHYAAIDSSDWGVPKSAVITWTYQDWPTIPDANWISTSYNVEGARNDSWRLFSTNIEIPACAINITGTISVTSDNAEEVYLNGVKIGSDGEVQDPSYYDHQEWETILDYPLNGLRPGANELKIIVRNYASNINSPTANPTGLIFRADINYDINPDCDNDKVLDAQDFCLNTTPDTTSDYFSNPWGVNRWYYDGSNWVQQLNKQQKGGSRSFTMADTHGCSCKQILDLLKNVGLGEFGGHYKYGCSTSILEDFKKDINDGVIDGRYFIETVTVPANKSTDTLSSNILASGINYILKARGVANAGDNIQFDARYSYRSGSSTEWTDLVSHYESYEATLLDLLFNGTTPWGDYNSSHEYEATVSGTGDYAHFKIYDIYYPNNTGNLFVDIYAQL